MKLIQTFFFLFILIFLGAGKFLGQELGSYEYPRGDIRVMFYNVENLFDVYDDKATSDEEYTPDGVRFWNSDRYMKKLHNISKVVTAVGQWEMPEVIGFCEIENREVLEDLIKITGLKHFQYRIIHKESPDTRGIDVGFLYRRDKFKPLIYEAVPIHFPYSDMRPTRDILYVKGTFKIYDTVHFFVNHWPSRFGGQQESERNREFAASVLRQKVDSLFKLHLNPKIIIMGDFNDYPTNNSMIKELKAQTEYDNPMKEELYNLSWLLQEKEGKGTHKHEGIWGVLDQIIVSGDLLTNSGGLNTTCSDAHIFEAPFLLEPDVHYTGYVTNRTFIGFNYHGGFSDHLPVYLDLYFK